MEWAIGLDGDRLFPYTNIDQNEKPLEYFISYSESYSIGLIWPAQYFKSTKMWILSWCHKCHLYLGDNCSNLCCHKIATVLLCIFILRVTHVYLMHCLIFVFHHLFCRVKTTKKMKMSKPWKILATHKIVTY